MNIMMVTPSFLPPKGGTGYHVVGLTKHLIERGHKIIIVTPSDVNIHWHNKSLEIFGVRSFGLPGWPYYSLKNFTIPIRPWSIFSVIGKIIRKYRVDVVHIQGQHYFHTWIAVKLAYKAKIPSVLTIHGTYGLSFYGDLARIIEEACNRTVLRDILQKTSAVICCTRMEEEGYVKRYYENVKCFDIPNGINVAIFQNALKHKQKFREEYEIPLDKRVILFLGSLVPRKGVLELLEAVKSVKEAFPEAFFVIVGEGPLWKEVKQYVNQGQVRAYGFVPDSEKHKLYVMSDIFILPSKSEGQPITLLEAMASQLHIVTTAVGGIPETLAGYGFKTYIKGCSPTEIVVGLSEAFRKISDDKTISSQTLSFVQRFDWGNITKETERVYNHVVHA